MILVRDAILTATVLALIFIAANPPRPAKVPAETPYCPVDVLQALKHPFTGEWVKAWGLMYRPCAEQDRFFQI